MEPPAAIRSRRCSPNTVATDMEVSVSDVDNLGRVTRVSDFSDLNRGDDDDCVLTTYANPVHDSDRPRVLSRPFQRIVTDCGSTPTTLSKATWEYDTTGATKLAAGKVTNGFVTAEVVTRLDEHGNPINGADGKSDIRQFDAVFNSRGFPTSVTTIRDDGATRTVATTPDVFDLVVMSTTLTGTNADGTTVQTETSSMTRDASTLSVLTTRDSNGQKTGATYDGFGRVLTSTIIPKSGPAGTMSSLTYSGFGATETGGRQVVQKVFADPVSDPTKVATTAGRTGTTYIDSLGRTQRTEVNLGADYSNQIVITGQRTFDLEGRVKFAADLFPQSQSFSTAYGTTQFFNTDGSP